MASNLNQFGGPITAIGDASTTTLSDDTTVTLTAASPSYQAIKTATTGSTVIVRLPNTSADLNGRVFCITNLNKVANDSLTVEVDNGAGAQLANGILTGDGNATNAQLLLAGDATSGRMAYFICTGAAAGTAGAWVHMGSVLYSA